MTNYYQVVVEIYLKDENKTRVKVAQVFSVEIDDKVCGLTGDEAVEFGKEMDWLVNDSLKNRVIDSYLFKYPDAKINNSLVISVSKL